MTETVALLREILEAVKAAQPAKEYMDVPEAAAYLGISEGLLWEMINLYKIPHVRVGASKRGRIMLRKRDLDQFMADNRIATPADALRLQDGRRKINQAA